MCLNDLKYLDLDPTTDARLVWFTECSSFFKERFRANNIMVIGTDVQWEVYMWNVFA